VLLDCIPKAETKKIELEQMIAFCGLHRAKSRQIAVILLSRDRIPDNQSVNRLPFCNDAPY
jgi:hypothetical protein